MPEREAWLAIDVAPVARLLGVDPHWYAVTAAKMIERMFYDVKAPLVHGSVIYLRLGPNARLRPELIPVFDLIAERVGDRSIAVQARKNVVGYIIAGLAAAIIVPSIICRFIPGLANVSPCKEILELWGSVYNLLRNTISLAGIALALALAGLVAKAWF